MNIIYTFTPLSNSSFGMITFFLLATYSFVELIIVCDIFLFSAELNELLSITDRNMVQKVL